MGQEAVALLEAMPGRKVLCIGDVMLDRYVFGDASRISPEAPVPVVHVKRQVLMPGGVGNVVKNLAAWGIEPLAVSVVGDDANADILTNFLSDNGKCDVALLRDNSRPTIVKTRIIAGIQQVVRFDEEALAPLADEHAERLLKNLSARLDGVGAVAVSDYGKGVMTRRVAAEVIRLAQARGCPVVIDPKGHDYSKYAGADLVKPNRKELGEAVGRVITGDNELAEAARGLMRAHGIRNLLVTLSEKGMLLFRECDAGATPVLLPSRAREVYDVTGAGDTVLAGMAGAMAVGADLALGARLATWAAGVVVGKVGTAVAPVEEIRRAAREA